MADEKLLIYDSPPARKLPPLPATMTRTRPRDYVEWKTLRRWGKLPPWEELRPGYVLREARERAGLSQAELARRLDCTQQAISQAERADSNPTASFIEAWARTLGGRLDLTIALPSEEQAGK